MRVTAVNTPLFSLRNDTHPILYYIYNMEWVLQVGWPRGFRTAVHVRVWLQAARYIMTWLRE